MRLTTERRAPSRMVGGKAVVPIEAGGRFSVRVSLGKASKTTQLTTQVNFEILTGYPSQITNEIITPMRKSEIAFISNIQLIRPGDTCPKCQ